MVATDLRRQARRLRRISLLNAAFVGFFLATDRRVGAIIAAVLWALALAASYVSDRLAISANRWAAEDAARRSS